MSTSLEPEREKRAQEKLARWIELDHKIVSRTHRRCVYEALTCLDLQVTYREVSREVGVNINAAKKYVTFGFTGRIPT